MNRQLVKVTFCLTILFNVPFANANEVATEFTQVEHVIEQLESTLDATIGVAIFQAESDFVYEYKGDMLFPLNSTFKALACANLLQLVDQGDNLLSQSVAIKPSNIVSYSPVTKKFINKKMSYKALCDAAITASDNTAANIVLKGIGGLSVFNQFMASIGDENTNLSRWEPELNDALLGDLKDTTTPRAIAKSLYTVSQGNVLSTKAKAQLNLWLEQNKTANKLIRSVLPNGWRVGDKTGAGINGSRGIVAVITPPHRQPVVVSIYMTQTDASFKRRNAGIAEISQAIIQVIKSMN